MGPRAALDTEVKRKIPSPRQESNPRTPTVQPIAQLCNYLLAYSQYPGMCYKPVGNHRKFQDESLFQNVFTSIQTKSSELATIFFFQEVHGSCITEFRLLKMLQL
jgi:hypothetical protein